MQSSKSASVALLLGGVLILDGYLWWVIAVSSRSFAIHFFDVGQGDSQLVMMAEGAKVLIDGGPDASVVRGLEHVFRPLDRYLDLVMITHPEADHFGGLAEVLKRFRIGAIIWNGAEKDTAEWHAFAAELKRRRIPVVQISEGDIIRQGESTFHILNPAPEFLESAATNDAAIASLFEGSGVRAFFTADIGSNIEAALIKKYTDLRADILKVGHHGSRFSSSAEFLSRVAPKVAVIQAGQGNTYGHPHREALDRLRAAGVRVFRTDLQGAISIRFNGQAIISTER